MIRDIISSLKKIHTKEVCWQMLFCLVLGNGMHQSENVLSQHYYAILMCGGTFSRDWDRVWGTSHCYLNRNCFIHRIKWSSDINAADSHHLDFVFEYCTVLQGIKFIPLDSVFCLQWCCKVMESFTMLPVYSCWALWPHEQLWKQSLNTRLIETCAHNRKPIWSHMTLLRESRPMFDLTLH